MFTVYKITNKINGKCYIGSSIRVEQRWKEHINCSKNKNNNKYNYPLYKAFRKYGLNSFTFEILKDDFNNYEEMINYEQDMIIYYNSLNNGYNQTLFTKQSENAKENLKKYLELIKCKCAKINMDGKILEYYDSYHDAARKNGFNSEQNATKIRQVCKGITSSYNSLIFRDLDKNGNIINVPLKNYYGRKTLIAINVDNPMEEKFFKSISDAAKQLNTDRGSISKCIQGNKRYTIVKGYIFREIDLEGNIIENNININERIKEYNKMNPVINGVRHSLSEWSQIYNINLSTIKYRIKNGWNVIEAITKRPQGGE